MSQSIDIILDSSSYKKKEAQIKDTLSQYCDPRLNFSDYENGIIRFFHKLKFIGNFLSHLSYWTLSLYVAIKLHFRLKNNTPKVFINPIVGFFYCFVSFIFGLNRKVYLAGFLFVPKSNRFYLSLRKKFVNITCSKTIRIIVYSTKEVELYAKWFPKHKEKFLFVPYGRDYDIFEAESYSTDIPYIASGGISNRDFKTLVNSLKRLKHSNPDLLCKIATRPTPFSINCVVENVKFEYEIRLNKFGSFIDNSLFVVLPLIDTPLSGGHMALMEAMYRKKIILITDITAVRDYVDENSVFFYNPNDIENLTSQIDYIYKNINSLKIKIKAKHAHEKYISQYCFNAFLTRIVKEVNNENWN
jgi:glycosyltransferase involved in cell wall biosynthesis